MSKSERKIEKFMQKLITPRFLELVEKWSKYDGEPFSVGDADIHIEDLGIWTQTIDNSENDVVDELLEKMGFSGKPGSIDLNTDHHATLIRDSATCSNQNKIVIISEKRGEYVSKRNPSKLYIYCVYDKMEEEDDEEEYGIYSDDSEYTSYPSLERLKKDFESKTFMHHNSLLREFCGVYTLSPFNDRTDRISNFVVIEGNLNWIEKEMKQSGEDYAKHIPIIERLENKHNR